MAIFIQQYWKGFGTSCSGRLCSLHSWIFSGSAKIKPWATWFELRADPALCKSFAKTPSHLNSPTNLWKWRGGKQRGKKEPKWKLHFEHVENQRDLNIGKGSYGKKKPWKKWVDNCGNVLIHLKLPLWKMEKGRKQTSSQYWLFRNKYCISILTTLTPFCLSFLFPWQ